MGIKLRFERPFVRDNTNRIVANESELVQQANLIATKVSQTDFNGNTISSLINQTATTIKIQAQKIQLEGLVTANNNFKVLLDGSIEAVNGKFSGNINGGTINIGSRFSVDASGNLVASNATLSGSITATKMVAPNGADYYGEIGVTSGLVGFGLFDLRYSTEAFFEVLEISGGNGFRIRDKFNRSRFEVGLDYSYIPDQNGYYRFSATSSQTVLKDHLNAIRVQITNTATILYSGNTSNYLIVNNDGIFVIRNNNIVASW